jgi:multidrug resistance efflux pump
MLELLLCSSLTILPDYLYRRFAQGKRLGKEITFFSVWYELRWGIVTCLILTVSLITTIFYFHPSTTSAVSYFRTISILPEGSGRVEEVFVDYRQQVRAGDPLFRLDASEQEAAAETARRRIEEVDAALVVARTELASADARIAEAQSAYLQALEELNVQVELQTRSPGIVAQREIERLQNLVDGRQAGIDATIAAKASLEAQIATLLPSQRASAEAALAQAEADLAKTTVYAGVDGWVEQFILRPGDLVSQVMRPAGILVPLAAGRGVIEAGFGQIEAQVIREGMIGEIACIAKPFTVVPVVITQIQSVIAAGQIRPTDLLVDPMNAPPPGTITAYMEPLFAGALDDLPPGSRCIANAYTSYHDRLEDPELGALQRFGYHAIGTVGLVHAMLLRLQALMLPVRTLVLDGGH